MALEKAQIDKHIAVLEQFEAKYRDYLNDYERGQGTDEWIDAGGPVEQIDDFGWSSEELMTRKREISELATRADRAMRVSGVDPPRLGRPTALGGGPMIVDLPSAVYYHGPVEHDESGTGMQRKILELIPSAIGGLRMKLEEAEEGLPPEPTRPQPKPVRRHRWAWVNHPWTIGIGTVLLAAIIGFVLHLS